jgi:tetratricopeptide (TPR) repeat protein
MSLKYHPIRVSHLCLRSSYLHLGNALSALDRNADAREVYEKVLPMLASEPRCGRLDWERSSIIVNIGNTYSREGNFDRANEYYDQAEQLGRDHVEVENGNVADGMGIMVVAMRARAFAMMKAGRDEEAKTRLREVLELQLKLNTQLALQKASEQEDLTKVGEANHPAGQSVEVA